MCLVRILGDIHAKEISVQEGMVSLQCGFGSKAKDGDNSRSELLLAFLCFILSLQFCTVAAIFFLTTFLWIIHLLT